MDEPTLRSQIILKVPAAETADFSTAFVDCRRFVGRARAILSHALLAGTTPSFAIKLEDSPDGTTGILDMAGGAFATISDAFALFQVLAVDMDRCQGFVRVTGTEGGTVTGGSIGVMIDGTFQQEP